MELYLGPQDRPPRPWGRRELCQQCRDGVSEGLATVSVTRGVLTAWQLLSPGVLVLKSHGTSACRQETEQEITGG